MRGTGLEPEDIATIAAKTGGAFHTRLATIGGTRSDLNHPFPLKGEERGVLIHNGSWREYSGWDISKDALSDTATAAELVSEHGLGCLLSAYFQGSGVWVNVRPDGGVTVVKRSGSIGLAKLGYGAKKKGTDNAWMLVSERPPTGVITFTCLADGVYTVNLSTGKYEKIDIEKIMLQPDEVPVSNLSPVQPYFWDDEEYMPAKPLNDMGFNLDDYKGLYEECDLCGTLDIVTYEPLPTNIPDRKIVKRVCQDCKTWSAGWADYPRSSHHALPVID